MKRSDAKAKTANDAPTDAAELFADGSLTMGRGYDRIQGRVFKIDEWAEYEELEAGLTLGVKGSQAERGEILDALDTAEENARRAFVLFANAEVALEVFEIDARAIEGGMRERARAELEAMKARGELSKAPTKDDIEAHMAAKFTDEYRDLSVKRAKAKRMVDILGRLADLWKKRGDRLQTMAQRS